MNIRDLEPNIRIGPTDGEAPQGIVIHGIDVTKLVHGLTFETHHGCLPKLTLELAIRDVTTITASRAHVFMTDATAELLKRAGWTPPPGRPETLLAAREPARRFIVLGVARDVEGWRREHGLSRRDVIGVSPHGRAGTLRGLAGDFEVITMQSWRLASLRRMAEVERDLQIIRATSTRSDQDPSTGPGNRATSTSE